MPELNQLPTVNTATALAAVRKAMDVDPCQRPHPDSSILVHDIIFLGYYAKEDCQSLHCRLEVHWEIRDSPSDPLPCQEVRRHYWVTRGEISAEAGEVFILVMRTKYIVGMRIRKEEGLEQC